MPIASSYGFRPDGSGKLKAFAKAEFGRLARAFLMAPFVGTPLAFTPSTLRARALSDFIVLSLSSGDRLARPSLSLPNILDYRLVVTKSFAKIEHFLNPFVGAGFRVGVNLFGNPMKPARKNLFVDGQGFRGNFCENRKLIDPTGKKVLYSIASGPGTGLSDPPTLRFYSLKHR